ncbi:hypothetical protein A7J50_6042 (plasmid) [Pseudomonas antarctica]|uniref:Uncharacterized protein n=1 Tax=Pseudomonas antarctica TaxID=219572 RepID=A0A172Z9Z0_9PSED|nr:hypothetical protein [Pseudomonas antarctica]ANF89330.1 hypothetical protein A7J50_6042 [Pseudomonas antarctica]
MNFMNLTQLENLLYTYGSIAAGYRSDPQLNSSGYQIARAECRGIFLLLSYVLEADEHGLTDEGFWHLQRLIKDAREKGFLDDECVSPIPEPGTPEGML